MGVDVDSYILVGSKWPQSQFRYCWWYRGSQSSDFDISEKREVGIQDGSVVYASVCGVGGGIRPAMTEEEQPRQCADDEEPAGRPTCMAMKFAAHAFAVGQDEHEGWIRLS